VLKALTWEHRYAVAKAALDGALSAEQTVQGRHVAALRLLDAVEPLVQVSASQQLELDPDGVRSLSVSQLLSIAEKSETTTQG